MLVSRLVMFAALQGAIALGIAAGGGDDAWNRSAAWWMLCAAAANVISFHVLRVLFRADGASYGDLWKFRSWRRSG
jgi:hypothetical protein